MNLENEIDAAGGGLAAAAGRLPESGEAGGGGRSGADAMTKEEKE